MTPMQAMGEAEKEMMVMRTVVVGEGGGGVEPTGSTCERILDPVVVITLLKYPKSLLL